jgi:hypothetical protein
MLGKPPIAARLFAVDACFVFSAATQLEKEACIAACDFDKVSAAVDRPTVGPGTVVTDQTPIPSLPAADIPAR